ncbi:ATP-binding protein [Maribacter arcticus]|uniref:histidine kinase n=1 Tax=Maribacter arcticus TaxID=561365 RepID=A0A1T5D0I6_9FLAO|nr:ATP-binding protein [Maribacter arcticus]SKB65232.1 Hpt domain-containing protein [Maribacter arcticus]|tara:strand:- start:916 stop:2676 length:1761 start_codon:yes stop_codon:yes gene_type:complete
MSISKTTDLLDQLSQLERSVSEFSFEELSVDEAKELKNSFNTFKSSLECQIFDPNQNSDSLKKEPLMVLDKQEVSQKEFITHVSHEIRTPLNSIIGFANLLKEEKLTSSQQKKVEAIQFASNTLLKLINEVLDYSKISSGNTSFESIDFKLHGLLNDVMFLCETLLVDSQVELIIDIDKSVPKVIKGDPSKLSQVILNLVGNSIKFVNQGFIKLGVFVKEVNENDYVLEFSVTDTGIGISKEKINSIFERYSQADNDTYLKYGGTGLGLSITKEIIEKQNGEIVINSVVSKGTTVSFTLPFSKGDVNNISVEKTKNLDIKEAKKLLEGTEIMVFEDNLMNQHLILEQLTKWGCNVHTNVTLEKGLAILATKKVDLILMDLKMPNLNGFEVSKAIRLNENPLIRNIPIVAFSADFTEQDGKDCDSIGINDFLLKPYTLNDLMSIIVKNKRENNPNEEFGLILQKQMIEPKETTIVDLNSLLKDCFGELEMLNELIKLFKTNVLEFIGNVRIHLKTDNLVEIAFSAHKLKASFAMLKATGMHNLILELEANCKANKLDKVKELYELFLNDYPLLENNLNIDLEILNKK